jgi:hypothetical protein
MLVLTPALAIAQPVVRAAPPLRGRAQPLPLPPATEPPTQGAAPLGVDPATGLLASPALGGRPTPLPGGGACRRSCASDLYLCREDRDEADCDPAWVRCVVGCPDASSSPL